MIKSFRILILIILAVFVFSCSKEEEKWMPEILTEKADEIFLPDFSFAGYHWGEKEIPNLEPNMNVLDYGAVPDDGKDDTGRNVERNIIDSLHAAEILD